MGKAAANSAQASAPARDNAPPNAQTTSSRPGLGRCSAITPLVVKIPTPMVLPTTSIVALNRPRKKWGRPGAREGAGDWGRAADCATFANFFMYSSLPSQLQGAQS